MAVKAFQNKVDIDNNILDIYIGNRYWSYTNIMDSSYIHICQRLNMYLQVYIYLEYRNIKRGISSALCYNLAYDLYYSIFLQ